MFFVFDIRSPNLRDDIEKLLTLIGKNVFSASKRVSYLDIHSFKDKIQIVRDDVFNFVIPYLLFLFTPIKFFKKHGDKFDFHFLLNNNNDYFEFDFIEVKDWNVFFQKDGKNLNVNVNKKIFLIYQILIENFSKNNVFTLIFVSWYCTVMSNQDKKKYIGDGKFSGIKLYNYLNEFFGVKFKEIKNFNSLISLIEGESSKMSKHNISSSIKQFLKIFAFLNLNVVSGLGFNNSNQTKTCGDKKDSDIKDQSDQFNDFCNINDQDKLLIHLLFKEFKKAFTYPILEAIDKEISSIKTWGSEELKIKSLIEICMKFLTDNKEDVINGLNNLKKTNRFLDDFRLKLIYFYGFWNYSENISLNLSFGADLSPKKSKITFLFCGGVDIKNLPILNNFYIDSVSLSVLSYEFDFSSKDLTFNGLSFLIFPSFFSLKNFKLFLGIRLHEHISFSIGASYVRGQQSL